MLRQLKETKNELAEFGKEVEEIRMPSEATKR